MDTDSNKSQFKIFRETKICAELKFGNVGSGHSKSKTLIAIFQEAGEFLGFVTRLLTPFFNH